MNVKSPFLSILTVGISGSARLREKLGVDEASWAIDRSMKRVMRAIEGFGGLQLKTSSSDEVMATFDTVDASLQAAVEMQQRVVALPPVSGVKIAIRIGISCGQVDGESQAISSEAVKEAAMLTGQAKPGQILASKKITELVSPALMPRVSDYKLPQATESGEQEIVLEISSIGIISRPDVSEASNPESSDILRKGCLRLLYYGETVLLNDSKTNIRMGRASRCDIIIRDRRASRHHATIERQGDLIVLIDRSANGTYVAIDGVVEQFVRHEECILHGRGMISFAASSTEADADIVEFELN